MEDGPGIDRREFLTLLGLGSGAVLAGSGVVALMGDHAPPQRSVGRWKVIAVHPVRMGAVPVVLETEGGERFQVDVLRRGGDGPAGVARTEALDIFVVNRGNGATVTDEEQGLAAIALGDELARRGPAGAELGDLLTFRERQTRYPSGAYCVPLA